MPRRFKVQYLLRRVDVYATGLQESVINYPVRVVVTPNKYLTQEGKASASGAPEG